MKNPTSKFGISTLALIVGTGVMPGANAQEVDGQNAGNDRGKLDTIVVEARRVEENVLDTPVSIGVLDDDFIDKQGIESVEDVLVHTPGATFLTFSKAQPEKSLRGFVAPSTGNASSEQSIVTVVDGFSLTKDAIKSPPVFDLERVEVLRGPQGTTFGRNASIGLIHLVTKKPTFEPEAGFNITAGSDERYEIDGYISGPLTDTLAVRLAGNFDTLDGFTESISTGEGLDGEKNFAVRGSAIWEPTDRFKAYVKVEYSEDNDEGAVRRGLDSTIPFIDGPRVTDFPFVGPFALGHPDFATTFFDSPDVFETEISDDRDFFLDRQIWTTTAELTFALTDSITVTSITGYQDGEGQGLADVLGTPENIVFQQVINDASVFSEEIRIDNHASGNRFRWLAGLYYLHDEEFRFQENQFFQTDLDTGLNPASFPRNPTFLADTADNTTDSYAIFGEVIYDFTDRLELAVGGRWSRDEKEATLSAAGASFAPVLAGLEGCVPNVPGPPVCASLDDPAGFGPVDVAEDFSDFTAKVSVNYALTDNHSVYFLWSQGFKSGGFQNSARTAAAAAVPFESENTNNFEVGWKGQIADQARFSLTAFRQRAENIQTVTLVPVGDGFQSVTSNVGAVRTLGLEGDFTYLVSRNFRLGGTFSLLDSELEDTILTIGIADDGTEILQDLSGQRPEVAPEWTGTFYAEYDIEMSNGSILTFRGDFTGRDGIFDGNEDRATTVRTRPTLTNAGARISYDFGDNLQYRISAWGKNLNEDFDIDNIGPFQPNTLQLPLGFSGKRQWGVTVSANF